MSTNTDSEPNLDDGANLFQTTVPWRSGAIAGFLATVVMGVAISSMNLPTMQNAIAGLYGQQGNLIAGWIAHLVHGTAFGVLFAAFLADPGLYRLTDWYWKTIVAGVVYGMVLAIVGAGLIMPIWLAFVGLPAPQIPNVTGPTLVWHLVYGLVLGALFPALQHR